MALSTRVDIQARDLSQRFGRTVALTGIDLAVAPGVFGLLGPTGPGRRRCRGRWRRS